MKLKGPTKTVWVTKDGQRIPVRDMEDDHVVNTIRLLRRSAAGARLKELDDAFSCLTFLNGDMAQMAVEQEIAGMMCQDDENWLKDHVPTYRALISEAARRGLAVIP